jgi:hypothetical protein
MFEGLPAEWMNADLNISKEKIISSWNPIKECEHGKDKSRG